MAQVTNIKNSEETHFLNLSNAIVQAMVQRYVNEDMNEDTIARDIQAAIRDITESFKPPRRDEPGRRYTDIDLSPLPYGCAYVQRLGTLGMGLARFKTLEALRNCEYLRNMFGMGCVNVVCLGGGPGTDVVGLTSALYESGIGSALNITIIDSVKEWSSFVDDLEKFVKEKDYGNASKYFSGNTVNLSFLESKLPSQDGNAIQAIRGAHIILMIRFISSIEGNGNQAKVIRNVRENMQKGAVAIVVDCPLSRGQWNSFHSLYFEEYSDEKERYRIFNSYSGHRFGFVSEESYARLGVFLPV